MSKKRNDGRRQKKRKQSNVSKLISNAKSPNDTLLDYFEKQNGPSIYENFKKVENHPYFRNHTKLIHSNTASDLYRAAPIFTTLEKSVYWSAAIIKKYKSEIQFAVDLESELTNRVLNKEFSLALQTLDLIAKTSGRSLWEMQLRGAIESELEQANYSDYSLSKSISENKNSRFANQIINKAASPYQDPETFYISSTTSKHEILRSAHPILKSFLTYKFYSYDPNFEYDFEKIFNIERQSSPIDIFFLVLRFFCHYSIAENLTDSDVDKFKKTLSLVSGTICHPILKSIESRFIIQEDFLIDSEIIRIQNKLDTSTNPIAIKINNTAMPHKFDIQVVEQIARTDIETAIDGNLYLNQLSVNVKSVLERKKSHHKHLERLAFDSYRYRSLNWFVGAGLLAERESDFVSEDQRARFDKLITIHSPTVKAENLDICNSKNNENLSSQLLKASDSESTIYYKIPLLSINKIEKPAINNPLYIARSHIRSGEHKQAIEKLWPLIKSKNLIVKNDSFRLLTHSLLNSEEYRQAINVIVDAVLNKSASLGLFDTNHLLNFTLEIARESKDIEFPIIYSLHSRYCDSKYDSELKYIFENFLLRNNAKFPQDLFQREDEFGEGYLKYFFKWVCTPENMKLYLEFETQRQIQNCRLEICNYLMETGDTSISLQSEIKEINKATAIKKAAQKVDNSRIYVNTDVFVGRNSSIYRDLFQHYENLTKKDFSSSEDEKGFEQIYEIFAKSKELDANIKTYDALGKIYFPYIRLNTKNSTFLSLFKLIREEFTFGEKGLNNHLSTRIRHGVLPTALRKPIVDEDLYISETSSEQDFLESSPWAFSESMINFSDNRFVFNELKAFTLNIEKIISEINDEWLQINTLDLDSPSIDGATENSNCLFRYPISPIESYALQKELPISPSYNDFIQIALRWLWEKTESNLELVQKQLNELALSQYTAHLDDLKNSVRSSDILEHQISEICNACDRSKQNLRNQIDNVCSWFTHIEGDSDEEYDLETAVDIAKKSLNVDVSFINNASCSLKGRALSYMVDIFFILFENAISKSNIEKGSVSIELFSEVLDDKRLSVNIENDFEPHKSIEELREDLDFYQNAYGDEELIQDVIQKEGGTGFFKIWKILEKDLETEHHFNIDLTDENKFKVQITLHQSKSITWNEDSIS